jgi:alpha-mannosidase
MSQLIERYFVVPHTHWDREWYRPFEHFRVLLGSVVDEVLDTLERDPEFSSFTLDGQAIVLEDYVAVRPANEPRLRALIAAGRIEVGPSYVLPDEFLVGAEALVRNLLIGRAVCERFGAEPSPAGYLPDSFGHPLQLPQILAGFGIETFLFSRGLGDEFDDVGVAFDWVAPDGSSVLALQLLGDYSNFANISSVDDAVARVEGVLDRFGAALERADVHEVVLCNGTDHWRIQPQMPSVCAELERRFHGSTFAIGRYGDYASALRPGALPSWTGELLGSRLWNVLRGVNSARLYLKQANEHAEQWLLGVETLAALCSLRTGARFPLEDVTFAWQELLKCHPHDSICGCSCDEVHRDMLVRYASLDRTLELLIEDALAELPDTDGPGAGASGASSVGVVNTLPFPRALVLRIDGAGPTPVTLGGFEAKTVELAPPDATYPTEGNRIESDRFAVELGVDGTLAVDDLARGTRFDGLHAIEDELDMGDLYNFCPVEGTGVWRCTDASSRILSNGPLCWELEVSYRGERPAGLDADLRPRAQTVAMSLRTVVRLVRGSERIEFETTIENAAEDHRARVVFPVGEAAGPVRAEGHFALVRRPLAPAPPRVQWCEPPDPTQHTLGAVALGSAALITRGLPEYEARPRAGGGAAELCLTLLRCVGVISRATGAIPTRPLGAGPGVATPEGQCLGRHVLEYALRFDADQLDDVGLLRASQDYRCGPLVVRPGIEFVAPLSLEGEVVFSCLKGAEDGDGLIVRVFNPAPERVTARLAGPALRAARVRLDETNGGPSGDGLIEAELEVGAEVEVRPGEMVSWRLRR